MGVEQLKTIILPTHSISNRVCNEIIIILIKTAVFFFLWK